MEMPKVVFVVIEWIPSQNRISVRGCWPEKDFKAPPLLYPDDQQNAVAVFEGVDMKSNVGFCGLRGGP